MTAGDIRSVAFIGLGRMGGPMAGRLVNGGFSVTGYDLDEVARSRLVEAGGNAVSDLGDLESCDVTVLMLPDSRAVAAVLVDGGLLDELRPGSLLVDMGSSDPRATRSLASRAAESGVELVDAPVSGGVSGATAGTLTIMVGGEPAAFSKVEPLLGVLGRHVLHLGGPGAGHAVKAINNLLSGTHLLSSCEALAAARRFGLDLELVVDAINTSSGRSGSTQHKWPTFILPEAFDSGFAMDLMLKDMRIGIDLIHDTGVPSFVSDVSTDVWRQAAEALGHGADHTEIARWVETSRGAQT